VHGLLLAVAYAALARSGLLLASVHGSVSPVWPATGVAIGALLLGGTRLWPAVLAGAFLANALTAQPLAVAAMIAVGNTLEALAGAWLWRGVVRSVPGLHEFRDVTGAVIASFAAPVASATIGVGTLVMTGTPAAMAGKLWFTWWAGDAAGALTVVPVLLAWDDLIRLIRAATPGDVARAIGLLAIALGVSWLAFALPDGGVFLFAIFPVLLLGSSWFGAAGARVLALLISAAGIAAACAGRGPFTGGDLNQSLLTLQVFLASIAISALVLPAFRSTRSGWLPGLVLLAGWTLSGWMFLLIQRADLRREEQFFTDRVAEAQAVIRVRLTSYIDALRGGAIFYTASKSVQREDWRVYTESLDIDQRLPAINGIGVIFVVRPGHEAEWLARARADGVPSLEIKPFPDRKEAPGDMRYVVTYLAPQSRATTDTFGRDIATEPTRRAAAEAARDAGEPRFHHRAAGSRDLQRRSGLLLYMPLYAKAAPPATVAERPAACLGWVYAQVFPDTLLQAVLGPVGGVLQLHFFEAGQLTRERLLYASQPTPTAGLPAFERVTELEIAGQPFQLGWRRGPKFPVMEKSSGVWAAASFALATVLLAGLVLNLQATSRRANAIAAERTAALVASEERFRSAFEDAGIGMALVSLEGRFLRVNRALDRIVGYSATELLTKSFQDITYPDDLAADLGRVHSLVAGVGSSYDMEKRYIHQAGHVVWTHITVSLVRDAAGRPMHFISQIEDITERKQLEENLAHARDQALAASRLKSEFLANMSHEIRTPMNAVSGMATLLAETSLTKEQRRMTRVIQTGAESLVAIINDILDFSRIEAGRLRLEPAGFDLRTLIEETVSLFGARAQEKGIVLECLVELAGSAYVLGDAGRVRQVLTNLVGNAIKFTERGSVVVAARAIAESSTQLGVRVEVSDTGIGIPPDARAHLFQPFTQADGSVTRRHGGTGLGLAISRQILDVMGGKIGYDSEVGRGTTFWFELGLPRAAGEAPPPADVIPPNCRVLVVDDSADDSDLLVHELGRAGVAAEVINDPLAALGNLRASVVAGRRWHAVFLDCRMPGQSGIELAMEIRADPELARTPLVLVSALGAGEHPDGVERAGFDAFLTKPARRDALRECLARVVRAAAPRDARPAVAVGDVPSRPLRLLVVEDNLTNQMVICMLLHKYGHVADVAENGEVALDRLRTQTYDAILMDCQMPVLDGFEATRRIRAGEVDGVDPRIPIIAVTAHALPHDRARCMEAGMNDFLTKPVRPGELTAALARWVMGVSEPEPQQAVPEVQPNPL
jgi:PAS domain S-box-containing protein